LEGDARTKQKNGNMETKYCVNLHPLNALIFHVHPYKRKLYLEII